MIRELMENKFMLSNYLWYLSTEEDKYFLESVSEKYSDLDVFTIEEYKEVKVALLNPSIQESLTIKLKAKIKATLTNKVNVLHLILEEELEKFTKAIERMKVINEIDFYSLDKTQVEHLALLMAKENRYKHYSSTDRVIEALIYNLHTRKSNHTIFLTSFVYITSMHIAYFEALAAGNKNLQALALDSVKRYTELKTSFMSEETNKPDKENIDEAYMTIDEKPITVARYSEFLKSLESTEILNSHSQLMHMRDEMGKLGTYILKDVDNIIELASHDVDIYKYLEPLAINTPYLGVYNSNLSAIVDSLESLNKNIKEIKG